MKIEELNHCLDRIVPAVYSEMARRFNFEIRRVCDGLFVLESECCWVKLRLGSGHETDLDVTLSPLTMKIRDYSSRSPDEFGLGTILESYDDPRVAFVSRVLRSCEDLRSELERTEHLLSKFCQGILTGDFSLWPWLRSFSTRAAQECRCALKNKDTAKIWKIRMRARVAFGQGDYEQAARLYEEVRGSLTERESKKYEYARNVSMDSDR